MRDEFFDE